jgi:hypothetical protein
MSNNEKFVDENFIKSISLYLLIVILICCLPFIMTRPAMINELDFSKTGEIGSTINGLMGPFIAIAASILTFIAFWVQYKANIRQTQQFKIQAKDTGIQRFENVFYIRLSIHRENTKEINIENKYAGRDAFVELFYELKYIYLQVYELYQHEILPKQKLETILLADISYHIFFFGVGINNEKLIYLSFKDKCDKTVLDLLINRLKKIKNELVRKEPYVLQVTNVEFNIKSHFTFNYKILNGHHSELGHYFRHLFQTIKFVDNQEEELIDSNSKRQYAKTLRGQLSDYEQLILFYNACSSLGNSWVQNGYIKEYRLIKNMPYPMADFLLLPEKIFEKEILYWKEKGLSFFE